MADIDENRELEKEKKEPESELEKLFGEEPKKKRKYSTK